MFPPSFLSYSSRADFCSIKTKNPTRFQRTPLFLRVLAILELHHFRLPVCRFVIDLFDKNVMRRIVLEEEADDVEEEEDEDESDDEALFRDAENGDEAGMERVTSSRSQAVTSEDDEDDERLFGGDGEGSGESLESEREVGLGRRSGEDMNGTTILRGNG